MRTLFILLIAIMSLNLSARVFVFPFRVTPEDKKEIRWLGRGASKFLSLGLEQNGFGTIDDEVMSHLLDRHNISFPYTMSKATAIALTKSWNGRYLVSGEVSCGNTEGEIQLRAWIIDLVDVKQYYSPLIKGRIDGIIDVQKELLRFILNRLSNKNSKPLKLDVLKMSNHAYELFVKAELVKDSNKRLEFLRKIVKDFGNVEAFWFEIAREHYSKGDYKGAYGALGSVKNELSARTRFLKGLTEYSMGRKSEGAVLFEELGKEWFYPCESANNIGVTAFMNGRYLQAEKSFIKALKIRKDSRVYLNLIITFMKLNRVEEARRFCTVALRTYPDNKDFLKFFQYFLTVSDSRYRDAVMDLFQEKIPEIHIEEKVPVVQVGMMNPFSVDSCFKTAGFRGAAETFRRDSADIDGDLERLGNILEANPFIDEYYRMSGFLYMRKKQFYKAEVYMRTALWLNPVGENYFALLELFTSADKDYEAEEMRSLIKRDFGNSEEINERLKKY